MSWHSDTTKALSTATQKVRVRAKNHVKGASHLGRKELVACVFRFKSKRDVYIGSVVFRSRRSVTELPIEIYSTLTYKSKRHHGNMMSVVRILIKCIAQPSIELSNKSNPRVLEDFDKPRQFQGPTSRHPSVSFQALSNPTHSPPSLVNTFGI